jgi:hypothetical protein
MRIGTLLPEEQNSFGMLKWYAIGGAGLFELPQVKRYPDRVPAKIRIQTKKTAAKAQGKGEEIGLGCLFLDPEGDPMKQYPGEVFKKGNRTEWVVVLNSIMINKDLNFSWCHAFTVLQQLSTTIHETFVSQQSTAITPAMRKRIEEKKKKKEQQQSTNTSSSSSSSSSSSNDPTTATQPFFNATKNKPAPDMVVATTAVLSSGTTDQDKKKVIESVMKDAVESGASAAETFNKFKAQMKAMQQATSSSSAVVSS